MSWMPHPGKQLLFALLSLADLALTWWLVCHSEGEVYEANPVARWWLVNHGWLALACFKVAIVLLVLGLTAVIARFRFRAAGRILELGCLGLLLVVGYSSALALGAPLGGEPIAGESQDTDEFNGMTLEELRSRETWRTLLDGLRDDLIKRRCTLPQAAHRLAQSEQARDGTLLSRLPIWIQHGPFEERLAAFLLVRIGCSLGHSPRTAWSVVPRLEREFRSAFGHPAPSRHRQFLPGRPPHPNAPDSFRPPSRRKARKGTGEKRPANPTIGKIFFIFS